MPEQAGQRIDGFGASLPRAYGGREERQQGREGRQCEILFTTQVSKESQGRGHRNNVRSVGQQGYFGRQFREPREFVSEFLGRS